VVLAGGFAEEEEAGEENDEDEAAACAAACAALRLNAKDAMESLNRETSDDVRASREGWVVWPEEEKEK